MRHPWVLILGEKRDTPDGRIREKNPLKIVSICTIEFTNHNKINKGHDIFQINFETEEEKNQTSGREDMEGKSKANNRYVWIVLKGEKSIRLR